MICDSRQHSSEYAMFVDTSAIACYRSGNLSTEGQGALAKRKFRWKRVGPRPTRVPSDIKLLSIREAGMQVFQQFGRTNYFLSGLVLTLLLVAASACGGAAATPVVVEKEVIKEVLRDVVVEKEVIKEVPRDVVVEKQVVKEIVVEVTKGFAGAESRQATAVPVAITSPEAEGPEVHPGKMILLGVDFGSERFDDFYAEGSEEFHSLLHAFNRTFETTEDGLLKVAPGIFTAWELSADGLTWTVTIREEVKFHDGRDLTRDDVLWTMLHQIGPEAQLHSHSSSNIGWSKRAVSIEAGRNQPGGIHY